MSAGFMTVQAPYEKVVWHLTKTWTTAGRSSNLSIAAVEKETKAEAIAALQVWCPARMDESGYVKVGDVTYVVAEAWNPLNQLPRRPQA